MTFNKIIISFSFVFMLTNLLSAQNNNDEAIWILEYNNGNKVEAEVKPFHTDEKKIKYLNLATKKKEKVNSDELKSITQIMQSDTLVFIKMKISTFNVFGKISKSEDLYWVTKIYGTNKMEGYMFWGDDFYNSSMNNTTTIHTTLSEAQAIRVLPEDYLFSIGLKEIIGINGKKVAQTIMNRTLKKYLASYCPEFAEKINKRTYGTDEIKKIIDEYTAQCK